MKYLKSFNEKSEVNKYSLVKVGGFRVGDYSSIAKCKKALKDEKEEGFYQIIDNSTGIAVWEGNFNGWNEYDKAIENRKKNLKK
jgi:hypothetical protein